MTLRQIASTIRNHVVDGLKGVTNEAFSLEQLMHEILVRTEGLIAEGVLQKTLIVSNISQRIDGIEIQCADTSSSCTIKSLVSVPKLSIPKLSQAIDVGDAISYVGPMDNSVSFKVYVSTDYRFHQYRQLTGDRPYVWINTSSNTEGVYDMYFFNLGKYNNLKFVSISALFENPYDLLKMPYAEQFSTTEFYAPAIIQNRLIEELTQRYVSYYRQLNTPVQPNTQETQ